MKKSEKTLAALTSRTRPGTTSQPTVAPEVAEKLRIEGLELSDLTYKTLSFFHENPENVIFRPLKKIDYFTSLEKDIREAGMILSPLIAMPNGLLIEGESRLEIAQKLNKEGIPGFERLPVRLILSVLSEDEQKKRLYLGNLSRFEIDEETRLILYAEIWSDFYKNEPSKGGRPKNHDTVSQFLGEKNTIDENHDTVSQFLEKKRPSAAKIAKEIGKSERQTKRDAAVYRDAINLAKEKGKEKPEVEDIRAARKITNEIRREKKPEKDIKNLIHEIVNQLKEKADYARTNNLDIKAEAYEESIEIIFKTLGI